MATGKKRTLGAERYPNPDEAVGERKAGSRAGERVRRRRKEHETSAPQGRRRQHERGQRQNMRGTFGTDGDQIARLKLQTQLARDQFINSLRASGITSSAEARPTQRKKISDLHQAYVSMMVLQCLDPLKRGVTAENVLRTVGMGTAMWLLSSNFRAQVGDQAGKMATAVGARLDLRARREAKIAAKGEKSREKEARHFNRTGQGREDMRGLSGWRHRRRLERVERMERGGRDLFTEHSAALTHVGIAQSAYDEMRKPGADRELIRRNYESALSALYGYVDDDGLDRKAVARNMRVIVGQLVEQNPEQAAVFSELGHGQFVKTEPQRFVLPGTTQWVTAWTGDYVDAYRGDVITDGTFALRDPMEADEHRSAVARTMYGELVSAKNPDEFSEVMEQYVIGSVTRKYPEAVELTEDAAERARLNRSRAMFASMRGDGLSEQEQKLAYVGGFVESLRVLGRTHPQTVAQWRRNLTPEREQRIRDLLARYSDFGEQLARDHGHAGERDRNGPGETSPTGPEEADIVDAVIVDDAPGGGRQNSSTIAAAGSSGAMEVYSRTRAPERIDMRDAGISERKKSISLLRASTPDSPGACSSPEFEG